MDNLCDGRSAQSPSSRCVQFDSDSDFEPTPRATKTDWAKLAKSASRDGWAGDGSVHNENEPPGVGDGCSKKASELVEIPVRKREAVESNGEVLRRRAGTDAVNQSAFDELPPAEVYDPTWNSNPLRCEAGKLGAGNLGKAGIGPLLPVAFTLRSSDLDDDDDEEEAEIADRETEDGAVETRAAERNDSKSPTAGKMAWGAAAKGSRSFIWPKRKPPLGPPSGGGNGKRVGIGKFDSSYSLVITLADVRLILEGDFSGEVTSGKGNDLRLRVPITTTSDTTVHSIVVSGEEAGDDRTRVSIRRSMTDLARISNEDFEWFVDDVSNRFQQLRHSAVPSRSKSNTR